MITLYFKKDFYCALWLALALLILQTTAVAAPMPVPSAPQVGAKSYVLQDYHSGRILAAANPDERTEPASLTKLMTMYVVFGELAAGNIQESDTVTVSEKAWRTQGSRMFIEVGSQVTVGELLRGIIIQSGNDASVAIAEHIAGSEAAFADLMNHQAAKLGMASSHFVNSTGLPHADHYVTARDMATLARAMIYDFPQYYALYSEREYTYNNITQYNRNRLLWRDPSVDGLKTGHTESAGYCLVTSAERESMRLVTAVLGSNSEKQRVQASQTLLNYGFRFYATHRLYEGGKPLTEAEVWKGASDAVSLGLQDSLYVTVPRGRYDDLKAVMQVNSTITAPVNQNEPYGKVVVTLGEETVAEPPLVALDSVGEGGWFQRLADEILLMMQ